MVQTTSLARYAMLSSSEIFFTITVINRSPPLLFNAISAIHLLKTSPPYPFASCTFPLEFTLPGRKDKHHRPTSREPMTAYPFKRAWQSTTIWLQSRDSSRSDYDKTKVTAIQTSQYHGNNQKAPRTIETHDAQHCYAMLQGDTNLDSEYITSDISNNPYKPTHVRANRAQCRNH